MKNIMSLLLILFSIQFIAACSSEKAPGYYPDVFAISPENAMKRLDNIDSQLFAQWVARVDKSCDARSVFAVQPTPNLQKGIDWNLFFEKLGKKYVLKDESGIQLMFGKPNFSTTTTVTRVFRSDNPMADNAYHLAAEFQLNNGTCEVYLYHQKVFETKMANSVPLIASWYEGKSDFGPTPTYVSYDESSTAKLSFVSNHGIDSAILAALRLDSKISEFLENKFGIEHDLINRIFDSNGLIANPHIIELDGRSILQFGMTDKRLIGTRADLDALLTDLPSNSNANVTIISPESETWNIHAKVLVTEGGTSRIYDRDRPGSNFDSPPNYKEVRMTNFYVQDIHLSTDQPSVKDAQSHFKNCVLGRFKVFEAASSDPVPYMSVRNPCIGLVNHSDFTEIMLGDKDLRELYVKALKSDPPKTDTKWNGWDTALREIADQYPGFEFKKRLDPTGESKIIQSIFEQRESVRQAIEEQNLSKEIRDAFQTAAFNWGLHGQGLAATKLTSLVRTAVNTPESMKSSTVALITALGEDPTSNDDTIDYISNLGPEFKVAVHELGEAAKKVGLTDWVTSKLSDGYQKRITEAQLASWKELVNRAAQFQDQETKLYPGKTIDPNDWQRHQQYIRALDEQWTNGDYEAARSFAKFAQFREDCAAQKDKDTFAVLNCLGTSTISNKDRNLLDPNFKGRYAELANTLQTSLTAFKGSEYFEFKKSVLATFMRPFWKTCRNSKFKKYTKELENWVKELSEETSFEKRNEIRNDFIDYMSDDCNWP
jgi:hypothetical protein